MNDNNCNKCGKCPEPCGCATPVFDIEAMEADPTTLRFNVNGKSVWYDFDSVVKAAETCTSLNVNSADRTLNYYSECENYNIAARELGSILHLADLGDVDAESIEDNGILNYRKNSNCGEGCEGNDVGWVSSSPLDIASTSLDYVLGADENGMLTSLMPPTNTTKFSYLTWAAQDKAVWKTPTIVAAIPDDGTYQYPVYMDPSTGELVIYQRSI